MFWLDLGPGDQRSKQFCVCDVLHGVLALASSVRALLIVTRGVLHSPLLGV